MLWQAISYGAQGKLLLERHGNGIGTQNRYHPTRGFVESSLTFRTANQQAVQNLELRVNDLGNVEWRRLTRHEAPSGAPVHEVKTESFSFDSQNRLTSSYVIGQDAQHFTFAANGNIASKTGTGSYTYGGAGAGPHAVTGVTLGGSSRRYTYDAKGRMENEYLTPEGGSELLLRQVAYTSFDQPQFIQHWRSAPLSSDLAELGESGVPWDQTCTMQFYFGAGLQRLISVKYKGLLKTQTLSLGGYEIRETTRGSLGTLVEKEERSSFGNGAKVKRWTAVNPVIPIMAYEYGVSDHLGSDSVTYTGEGQEQSQRGHLKEGEVQKTERQSYDAWGARRNADTWAPAKGPLGESNPSEEREGSNLARGYTGHEMLDDVGLVHMNGRLYDPSLGRMCGADPYVQTPENLQNYNRYSYVLNNPLSQIDPSGHFIIGLIVALGAAIIGAIGAVISTVLAFVAYLAALAAQFVVMVAGAVVQAFGAMGGVLMAAAKAGIAKVATAVTLKKIAIGAALSATYNGAQTAINGGSFSDVLKSAAIGAVTGAVGAVVGGGMHVLGDAMGSMLQGGGNIVGTVVHLAAHGAAGGGMSEAMGGSFEDGFIGGVSGAGVAGAFGNAFSGVSEEIGVLGRTAVAAVGGGVASVLSGGKFADGAFSAAFFHLFNNEASGAFTADGRINKSALQKDGADIYVIRESRDSPTGVLVYEDGEYLGGYRGNIDPNGNGGSDYIPGKRGPPDGTYTVNPKPHSQDDGGIEFVAGTPSITGKGRAVGSPAEGYNPTIRVHPYGGSKGCQTTSFEWADRIWDIVARNPAGSVKMHIRTQSVPIGIPVGPPLPKPSAHPWPPFTKNRNPYQPY